MGPESKERLKIALDSIFTKLSFDEVIKIGDDLIIHPRGGERITVVHPEGFTFEVGGLDIIHLKEERSVRRVTLETLPEGYVVLEAGTRLREHFHIPDTKLPP